MDMTDEKANPLLYINAVLRVDKKPQCGHSVGRHHLWDVDVALMLQQPLWYVIEEKGGESGWEIDTRKAVVRAKHSSAKQQKQSLENPDEEQWDLMNNLILAEVERWGSKDVDLTIEINGYSTVRNAKTTSNIAPATCISTPTASLTSTDSLLDQQEARREQPRLTGDYNLDLMERWPYYNPHCSNQNG